METCRRGPGSCRIPPFPLAINRISRWGSSFPPCDGSWSISTHGSSMAQTGRCRNPTYTEDSDSSSSDEHAPHHRYLSAPV